MSYENEINEVRKNLLNKALQTLEPGLTRILSKQGAPFSSDQVRAVQQYMVSEGHISSVDMNYLQQQLLLLERRILPADQQRPQAHQLQTPMNFEREMTRVRLSLGDQAWSKLEPQLSQVLTAQGRPPRPGTSASRERVDRARRIQPAFTRRVFGEKNTFHGITRPALNANLSCSAVGKHSGLSINVAVPGNSS